MNSSVIMKNAFIVARVMSAIFVGFALFMLIGSALEGAQKVNPEPTPLHVIVQLSFFGIGLLGLILAWKWKIAGGVISLAAFITLFIINVNTMVWIMIIFPANALLFILIGLGSRHPEIGKQ